MKKIFTITLFLVTCLILFSGCGAKMADEKRIHEDLEADTQFRFLGKDEEISEIIIEKRQTDKSQRTDIIWCTITVRDLQIAYQKEVVLTYGLYDKENWILDDISVNDSNQWIQTPLKGVNESTIQAELSGHHVFAEKERWDIRANQIKNFTIESHETDLERKTDVIAVSLTIDDVAEQAVGQLVLNYKFDNGWKIDSITGEKDFTAVVKPEAALNITIEDLIDEIAKEEEFKYGETKYSSGIVTYVSNATQQTVTIDRDAISDLVIESSNTSQKGSCQTYRCSCILTKPYVEFRLDAEIQYYYTSSDGWKAYCVSMTPQVVAVNIDGEWGGTYRGTGTYGSVSLSLQTNDDGLITAIYRYTPTEITKYNQPGSYYATGEFDMSTLCLKLTAGDWIEEPGLKYSWTKANIVAMLQVDDSRMKGDGHENCIFILTYGVADAVYDD